MSKPYKITVHVKFKQLTMKGFSEYDRTFKELETDVTNKLRIPIDPYGKEFIEVVIHKDEDV